jgi:hypothetical protein
MNNETQTDSNGFPDSIKKKYEFAKEVAVLVTAPIYTILHFLLGLRYPQPWILVLNCAGLVLFPMFFPALAKPIPYLMPMFGIVTLVAGLIQRRFRWAELLKGQIWHSRSNGIGYIELIKWWPEYLRRENRLVRFVEPLLVSLVGLIVASCLSRAFGLYLMITASFMWLYQNAVYEAAINALLDMLDGIIFSDAQSRNLAYYNNPNPTTPPPTTKELEGTVATGITSDLLKTINAKRAKKRNAPDNQARA